MATFDVLNSCRVCLQVVSGIRKSFEETQNSDDGSNCLSVRDIFWICTGYPVLETEPQQMCMNCAFDLERAYDFRKRCDYAQTVLYSKLSLVPASVKIEVEDECSTEQETISPRKYSNDNEYAENYTYDQDYEDDHDDHEETDKKPAQLLMLGIKKESDSEPQKKFYCEYCDVSYKSGTSMKKHYNVEHQDMRIHECPHCKDLFFTSVFLESHIKKCKKREKTAEEKAQEAMKHKYICPVCGILASISHINSHSARQSKKVLNGDEIKEAYVCDLCGSNISSRGTLITHMKVIHLNQRSKCKVCGAQFRSSSTLSSHIRKFHLNQAKVYKCFKCDYVASSDTNLRQHKLIHAGTKVYKCPTCGHEFLKSDRLKLHMASHSDARPYACEICQAAYKTTKALNVHMKTHTGYEYECPVCQRSYLTNQLMRNHVQKTHPEYDLPPPGTILSKSGRKRLVEQSMREMAIRNGVQKGLDEIKLDVVPPIEQALFYQPH